MGKSVSLIATVLDEEGSVGHLLDSVVAQTRQPDEVVVVDGGSRDRTVEVVHGYADRLPIRVISRPGCNISQGRNAAIGEARGEIIASTDAGVRLTPNWLADIVRALDDGDCEVVSGFFLSDPQTTFETAMGAAALPLVEEIDPKKFLPSSRSIAFMKDAAIKVGGYPEWLDYCEDLFFDLNLRRAGVRFGWAPEAIAHFRPRSSLRAFYKQYYQYARGDGKAGLFLKRHLIRYATYILAPLLLVAGLRFPLLWLLLVAASVVYLGQSYRRLIRTSRGWPPGRRLVAALWVPAIRLTGDVAKMVGYPVGVWWRVKRGKGQKGKW